MSETSYPLPIDRPPSPHLVIRQVIVAISLISAFVFAESVWFAVALYCSLVTLLEIPGMYFHKKESSKERTPSNFLPFEGVTSGQMETYCRTRRKVRFLSAGIGLLAGVCAQFLFSSFLVETFCVTYLLLSVLALLYLRFIRQIPFPKMVYSDNRYYMPHSNAGFSTPAEHAAANIGWHPIGPMRP